MAIAQSIDSTLSEDVFEIIADEVGIARDEITEDTDFSDLGIDAVLAKIIISRVSRSTKAQLPSTIFEDCTDAQELHLYLKTLFKPVNIPSNCPKPGTSPTGPLSNLLQGKPNSSRKTIFLLPDGSGSGMAYMRLPAIAQDVCLIGMNSPFLNATSNYPSRLEDLAPIWVEEIRSRKPVGPYILGGWSAGGYYAFEVAKQLIEEGDTVEKLTLIDSPCRLVFEELPMAVVNYLSAHNLMGNWGDKKAPDWMIEHFDVTIKAISKYMPTRLETENSPEVFVIWAPNGVLTGTGIDATETGLDLSVNVTQFMLENKDDQDPYGWDELFPGGSVSGAGMTSGNHFSLVYPPDAQSLSSLLKDVVQDNASKRQGNWSSIRY